MNHIDLHERQEVERKVSEQWVGYIVLGVITAFGLGLVIGMAV